MDKARLYQDGTIGKRVFAREIDDEPWWRQQKIPLICPFCVTPVVSQRTSVGRAPRSALFRLAADQRHEDVCPLSPTEVLQKIARGAQGVAVIEGDELHLVLPADLGQIGATTPAIDTAPTPPDGPFGVDISTVRPLLPPLINSAVVIARFLQKHGYDSDVVAQFKVRRPGEAKAVAWDEFCHGPAPDGQARLYTAPDQRAEAGTPGRCLRTRHHCRARQPPPSGRPARRRPGLHRTHPLRSSQPPCPARRRHLRPGCRHLEGVEPEQGQARAANVRRRALAARPLDLRPGHRPQQPTEMPAAALTRPARLPPGPHGSRHAQARTDRSSLAQAASQPTAHARRAGNAFTPGTPGEGGSGDRSPHRSADTDCLAPSGRARYGSR